MQSEPSNRRAVQDRLPAHLGDIKRRWKLRQGNAVGGKPRRPALINDALEEGGEGSENEARDSGFFPHHSVLWNEVESDEENVKGGGSEKDVSPCNTSPQEDNHERNASCSETIGQGLTVLSTVLLRAYVVVYFQVR